MDQTAKNLGVAEVGLAMQRFGWIDYIMFMGMLFICVSIGLFYGCCKKPGSTQEYLVGGRTMKILPVTLSLVASWVSGISMLGIPTEIYVYGIQYIYILFAFFLMCFAAGSIYLPVFHGLQLTSTYEYHERRFDKRVRLFGSVLFTIGIISWLPIVIYVPALAFNQVTGVNVHLITPIVCLICIFYTSLGGLKAVVWTDVIQTVIMVASSLLVVIKGTFDIGGFNTVIERNWKSGRLEGPNLDLNPLSRHTFWALTFGGLFFSLQTAVVNQNMIQRYLALPTLSAVRWALWLFFLGILLIVSLSCYSGLLIFATYHECDPLTTMLAKEKDQLLPLLVMEILGNYPGLPGIFVAGIFSAALSSLSTGLNAMAAVVLEDFYKSIFRKPLTDQQSNFIMKLSVVIMGLICVGLAFVVEKLGAVLQLAISIGAISSGPSLGIITMGVLLPWVNAKGAFYGGISALTFMCWLCLQTQSMIASGDITFPEKPVTTAGCHYDFIPRQSTPSHYNLIQGGNHTDITHTDEQFMIYRLSYLWYTILGTFVTILVGVLVSFFTKPNDPRDLDTKLLAPFVRKWVKPRNYPNQPESGIIYAYGTPMTNLHENSRLVEAKI